MPFAPARGGSGYGYRAIFPVPRNAGEITPSVSSETNHDGRDVPVRVNGLTSGSEKPPRQGLVSEESPIKGRRRHRARRPADGPAAETQNVGRFATRVGANIPRVAPGA